MPRLAFLLVFLCEILSANCLECHANIEKFDEKNHDFSCQTCHLKKADFSSKDHSKIIAHPGSNEHMDEFCSQCHSEQIKAYKNSNHFTHKNEIKAILTAFDIDKNLTMQDFLKPKNKNLENFEDLVLDMVERKCLRCHTAGHGQSGAYHGLGCMACHTHYAKNGRYSGKDEFGGVNLHSKTHELKKANNETCQSCHNKYFVGADYSGLFPTDEHKDFRTPLDKNGNFPSKKHGTNYHQLSPDIHEQIGLSCISCHTSHTKSSKFDNFDDFFGNQTSDFETKTCQGCHTPSPNFAHASYHANLSCNACHASWQGNFYELNIILDESKNYAKWQNLAQNDEWINKILRQNTAKTPKMPNLNGEMKNGIYHSVFSLMRFENVFLLNDTISGKIELSRPIFDYNLMRISKNGNLVSLNNGKNFSLFAPFSPHTITKQAKNCELCHANSLQFGKTYGGISEFFVPKFGDTNATKLLNATPLSPNQLKRLNSQKYKKIRAKSLIN